MRDCETCGAKIMNDEEEINQIKSVELQYGDMQMALHCKHCMEQFQKGADWGRGKSPREAMSYEAVAIPMEFPNGMRVGVVSVWCKRCGRHVWDSRHLQPLY